MSRRHWQSLAIFPKCLPADDAAKIKSGAGPDVVRLSIGIEDKDDIIEDLQQGLKG